MSDSKIRAIDSLSLQDLHDEADLIPLMTAEDEDAMNRESLPEVLPILPLRNTVLFPGVVVPITAGRDKSIKLINETNKGNKIV
jgi:ATP-dependent Lon protease